MSLIQVSDVQDALPTLAISNSSQPTSAQVQKIIDTVEGEVRALLASCFAPWPDDITSVPGAFVRDTIIEGAKNLTLRAKYAMTPAASASPEIGYSRDAYNDRLKRICDVAKAVRENTPSSEGSFIPVVGAPDYAPGLAGTFNEYTMARNWVESTRYRPSVRPWPL